MAALLLAAPGCNRSPQAQEGNYLRRGSALLQKKDYARALLEFKNASAIAPRDAEPFYQSALAYLQMGNLPYAIAALKQATVLNPKHEGAQVKLAALMATTRSAKLVEDAAERLRMVLSASPDDFDASDVLAIAEWKLGKTSEAVDRLEATLRRLPDRLQSSVELARIEIAKNNFAAAERALKQAVTAAPQSSMAEFALAQLYVLEGSGVGAEAELRKALALDSRNGTALASLAGLQMAAGRLDEAEQSYRKLSGFSAEYNSVHAAFLFTTGQKEAALAKFEKLAREAPGDADARTRLIAADLAVGRDDVAMRVVAASLKRNPDDCEALLQQSALLLRRGQMEKATEDLKRVLHFKSDSGEAHFLLARVYGAAGQMLNARQELNEALRLDPTLLVARIALARNLMDSKASKAALELLNSAPEPQKNSVSVATERNWILLASGDTQTLRAELSRELQARRTVEFVLQDGWLRLAEGDSAGARADAEEVLRQHPDHVPALRILAESYAAQKENAKAEEVLKAAAAANPQSAQIQNLLGDWFQRTKNAAGARKAFEAAVAADPKSIEAALALAVLDIGENHTEAARRRLHDLLIIAPANVDALLMSGGVAMRAGGRQEAEKSYRAVLRIDESNVMALNNLAYLLVDSNPDEALKLATQAATIAPDNATVQDTLGWVFYRKGMFRSAVQYLEMAVKKEPTPRRQFHLGLTYLKCGDRDRGERTMELALRQDPNLLKAEDTWR